MCKKASTAHRSPPPPHFPFAAKAQSTHFSLPSGAPPSRGGDACARPFLRILLHDATTIIIRHQNPRRTSFSNPDTAMPFLNPLPEKTEPHPPWEHGRLAPAPNGPCMKMAWSHCSGTRCQGKEKQRPPVAIECNRGPRQRDAAQGVSAPGRGCGCRR